MLTISKLMAAITYREKTNISQNRLAASFNTSPSTINAWIKENRQPQMDATTIYDAISDCRKQWTPYTDESVFIENIISFIDLAPSEKDNLMVQFNLFKNKYSFEGTYSKRFFVHLIELALDKAEIRNTIQYDLFSPIQSVIGIGMDHVIAATNDGRVLSTGANDYQQCNTHAWRNIASVSAGWRSSIGLKTDGSCIAIGYNTVGNGELFNWNSLISVCGGTYHFLGLKKDGTVVSYGLGGDGQCNVSEWRYIKALAAGTRHSVGLCEDGTVVACGSNSEGQCEVSSWKHIKQIAASGEHTIALTEEGEILLAGNKYVYSFLSWRDIVSIATGFYHIVGLKSDGTVLHTGHNGGGLEEVFQWWNVKAIYAGYNTTAGITSDGNVLITNDKHDRTFRNVSLWNLYGRHRTQGDQSSPFDASRREVIVILKRIYELGLHLSSDLHKPCLNSEESACLEEIRELSRETWKLKKSNAQIKPLADLLLWYNAAFVDFFNDCFECVEEKTYLTSDNTYDSCVAFLTEIRRILAELRSI